MLSWTKQENTSKNASAKARPSSSKRASCPRGRGKDNSDLLFAVPNSGADGETLFSLADYETCLADDVCEAVTKSSTRPTGLTSSRRSRPRARGGYCLDTIGQSS